MHYDTVFLFVLYSPTWLIWSLLLLVSIQSKHGQLTGNIILQLPVVYIYNPVRTNITKTITAKKIFWISTVPLPHISELNQYCSSIWSVSHHCIRPIWYICFWAVLVELIQILYQTIAKKKLSRSVKSSISVLIHYVQFCCRMNRSLQFQSSLESLWL